MLLEPIVPFLSTSIDIIRMAKVKNDDEIKKSTRNDCDSLLKIFDEIFSDCEFRDTERCSYSLPSMILRIFLAVAAESTAVTQITKWVHDHQYDLAELHPELSGEPSYSSIFRCVSRMPSEVLQTLFCNISQDDYTKRRKEHGTYDTDDLMQIDQVAFDGQCMNATKLLKKEQNEEGGLKRESGFQIVSLTSKKEKMVLAQRICTKKNQEVSETLKMLTEGIDISGTVLTADALNTCPAIAEAAIKCRAHWLLNVKRNHSRNLLERDQIEHVFTKAIIAHRENPYSYSDLITEDFSEIKGGYHFRKTIYVLPVSRFLKADPNLSKYPEIKYVAMIFSHDTLLRCDNVSYCSEDIFITSLENKYGNSPEAKKKFALGLVNVKISEWCVETIHQFLDHDFRQDNLCLKKAETASNRSIIHKFVLNGLLKEREEINSFKDENAAVSLNYVMSSCNARIDYAFRLLFNIPWKKQRPSETDTLVEEMRCSVEELELYEYQELMESNTPLSPVEHYGLSVRIMEPETEFSEQSREIPLEKFSHKRKRRPVLIPCMLA